MKKYFIYNIAFFALVALILSSCYSGQDVAPIDSPDDNPTATLTPMADYSSVAEGDTLKYTISLDKTVRYDIQFGVVYDDNSVVTAEDIEEIGGLLTAYSLETELWVILLADDFPEIDETMEIEIGAGTDLAFNWQLSPASDVVTFSTALPNTNFDGGLTVAMSWPDPDHAIDFDFLVESELEGSWGAAATADNPEITTALWTTDDDGSYFFGFDPYTVPSGVDVPFTISVGYPDGTVEFFDGAYNSNNTADYTVDQFTAWGSPMYRALTVVKTGSTFNVTFEF